MMRRSLRRIALGGAPLAALAAACAGPHRDMNDVMIVMEREYRSLETLLEDAPSDDKTDFPYLSRRTDALGVEIEALQALDAPPTVDEREFARLGQGLRAPLGALAAALTERDLPGARNAMWEIGEGCERCHEVAGWE